MESVIDARGGVIYATGSLGRCLWNPKIRPTQVPAHTQNKDHTNTKSSNVNVLYVVGAHI